MSEHINDGAPVKPPIAEDVIGEALEAAVSHDIPVVEAVTPVLSEEDVAVSIPAAEQIMIREEEDTQADVIVAETVSAQTVVEVAAEPVEVTAEQAQAMLPSEEDAPIPIGINRKDQKVLVVRTVVTGEALPGGEELSLPPSHDADVRSVLERLPNVDLIDNPEGRDWAETLNAGLGINTFGEAFVPTLEEDGASFSNHSEHNGIDLDAQPPRFQEVENQNMKGERAVIRVIDHLGLGTIFQTPLWHSGMWVTFKPPSETEIVELNRLLVSDKIAFGRYTYGLAFSNVTSYTIDRLFEFALSHVYNITAKADAVTLDNLKQHIVCQDIPSFLWGFLCTMYPRGFNYRTACIANPTKCKHVTEETLNVSKLQWVNMAALTEWQKAFMTGRQPRTKDLASIKRYQEELVRAQRRRVVINEGTSREVAFTLKTPTVVEYIDAGHRWIGDIVSTVDQAMGVDVTAADRNSMVQRHGQASAMRQYAHWVESIEVKTNVIDDRETIENTLNLISSDDDVRAQFTKFVVDFINGSTMAVIGIPTFDCPNCSKPAHADLKLPNYTNIIPLDVVQLFFVLLSQRLARMEER